MCGSLAGLFRQMTLSILEHATLMAGRIRSNPEDWEKRQAALLAMRREVEGAGDTGVFNADLWRVLREPLENTLVSTAFRLAGRARRIG